MSELIGWVGATDVATLWRVLALLLGFPALLLAYIVIEAWWNK
jgi:hypothetical protein